MSNRATCEDCQHFRIEVYGNGRTEPQEVEPYCEPSNLEGEVIEELWGTFLGNETRDAVECPGFKPILVKKCDECGKPLGPPGLLGEPAGLYTYQVRDQSFLYDRLFFCSHECKQKAWISFRDHPTLY